MDELNSSKLVVDKSKFFGRLYHIDNIEEIKKILEKSEKDFKGAKHHCYAAIFNNEGIAKSDGEVGSPGKILLETLKKNKLNYHCIIVSRVFGGIKLGPAGVSRAFRECAQSLVQK